MSDEEVRLFAHRWDMHSLQALAKRDHATLRRVFTELRGKIPARAVDSQVETFGYGAPMQFHSYGFLDSTAGESPPGSKLLFDCALQGDSLLLIALRHHDPLSAIVLIQAGGSLDLTNCAGETPLGLVYSAFTLFKLRDRDHTLLPRGMDEQVAARILRLHSEYAALFEVLDDKLEAFHEIKARNARDALTGIYREFAPDRLAKVDAQLREFEFREEQLVDSVRNKYTA